MDTVGIRELRQNPAPAVDAAARGQVVVVTDRGRPVAQLSPFQVTWRDRAAAAGTLRPATRDGSDLTPPLQRQTASGTALSEILARMREDER